MTTSPLDYIRQLARAEPRDLRTLQLRLTHVGVQRKSVPAVVLTSFYHLPRAEWFTSFQSPSLNYGGPDAWYATLAPDDFPALLARLADAVPGTGAEPQPLLSFIAVLRESRLGEGGCELRLGRGSADTATAALLAALRDREPAHTVLTLQRSLLLPESA
jgi:hypothetical protein